MTASCPGPGAQLVGAPAAPGQGVRVAFLKAHGLVTRSFPVSIGVCICCRKFGKYKKCFK